MSETPAKVNLVEQRRRAEMRRGERFVTNASISTENYVGPVIIGRPWVRPPNADEQATTLRESGKYKSVRFITAFDVHGHEMPDMLGIVVKDKRQPRLPKVRAVLRTVFRRS